MIVHKLPCDHQAAITVFHQIAASGKVLTLQTIHDYWCEAIQTQRDTGCASDCTTEYYILEIEPEGAIEFAASAFVPPQGGLN